MKGKAGVVVFGAVCSRLRFSTTINRDVVM